MKAGRPRQREEDHAPAERDDEGHVAAVEPRVAAVLNAQQGVGNQAVTRMLMRNENPALEAKPEPQVKHKTGKEIDAYADASPFFKKYVGEKIKGGTKAEGNVHIHTPGEYKKKWREYALARNNPDTGKTFTEAEADAWEPNVNAFQGDGEIHVHQDRGEAATTIHESMHLYSDASWKNLGFNPNEGATEFFTKKLCAENSITRGAFYPDQYASVKKLADAVGEDTLARGYFDGDIDAVKTKVDRKKGWMTKLREWWYEKKEGPDEREGTWDKWVGFMNAGKYAEADALLN
jgi:hypothetical protein